jgi:hypothetical protein
VPNPTPSERFATLLQWLSKAVGEMSGGDRLSYLLIGLIIDRIRGIKQGFARIAARIRDGKYAPRRFARRRPPAVRRPRPPNPLPHTFGWLLNLVPDAVAFRSQLESLLQNPEMAALLATAQGSLRRPLRSLCWMLRVSPPPILARPRPAPAKDEPATTKTPPKRPPPPSPPPARAASAPEPPPPARACGLPLPA